MHNSRIVSVVCAGVLILSLAGCGDQKKDTETFDAGSYAAAYLDGVLKGDSTAYQDLNGQTEDLSSLHSQYVESCITAILGNTSSSPGGMQLSPQQQQDYTELWTSILSRTQYTPSSAQKQEDGSYQVTFAARPFQIISAARNSAPEYSFSDTDPDSSQDVWDSYADSQLELYRDALSQASYGDEVSVPVTLFQSDEDAWILSENDVQTLMDDLLDLSVLQESSDPSQYSLSEGSPETADAEAIAQAIPASLGETVSFYKDESPVADFSIDQIEVTSQRSEFDPSDPEQVVIITYTYTNTHWEDPVLFDELSFTVMDGDTACMPYYLQNLSSADIAEKGGNSVTASLAYGVSKDCSELTVYVKNPAFSTSIAVTSPIHA